MIVLKTKIVLFVSVLLALQGITNAVDTNDHVWLMTMIAVAVCVLIAPVIILVTHATIMTKMPQERLEYAYAFSAGALISLAYMSLMIEGMDEIFDGDYNMVAARKGMSVFMAGFLFTQIVHCYIDKYSGIEDAVLDIKHGNTVREKDTATPPASYTNLPEILSSIGHNGTTTKSNTSSIEDHKEVEGQSEQEEGHKHLHNENNTDVNVSKPIVDLHFSIRCANGLPGRRELFDMRNLSPIVWTVRGSRLRPKFPRILITYCHHILIATLVLLTLYNSSFQPVAFYHVYICFVFYCYTCMYV
eukprot:207033_1